MLKEPTYLITEEDIFNDYLNNDIDSFGDDEDGIFVDSFQEDDFESEDVYDEYYSSFEDEKIDEHEADDNDEYYDEYLDLDFSQFKGDFKTSLKAIDRKVSSNKRKPLRKSKPIPKPRRVAARRKEVTMRDDRRVQKPRIKSAHSNIVRPVRKSKPVKKATITQKDDKILLQGVDNVILSKAKNSLDIKNIGYYNGEKLKELVFTIRNDSLLDFDFELFNPSMPLDYLHATSLNLNSKIEVAGGIVSYTDVLFNLLANPTCVYNAKLVFAGATYKQQMEQSLIFKNKSIEGKQKIHPLQISLQIDNKQYQNDIVFFNLIDNLERPFIPNGMDVLEYKIFAGNTVTFAFFVKQVDLRKIFFKEAKTSKILI